MPLAFSSYLQVQNLEREEEIKHAMVKNQIHFTSHTVQRDLAHELAALGKFCPQKLCAGEVSALAHKAY